MADETGKTGITVAKRHQVLQDIAVQTKGIELTDVCTIAGHKYLISTLTTDEEIWADGYVNVSNAMSAFTSAKPPVLAASIRAIDDIGISDLFEFSGDEKIREFHTQSIWHKRYWQMSQLLLWLGDRPSSLLDELWKEYKKLEKRRDESWDALKKSCARIPGGGSKVSSSPERESSRAVPTSKE